MPRKALYNGLGGHSLMWQANPCEAVGWPVGPKTPPAGPIVKGNRGINAQTVGSGPGHPTYIGGAHAPEFIIRI